MELLKAISLYKFDAEGQSSENLQKEGANM